MGEKSRTEKGDSDLFEHRRSYWTTAVGLSLFALMGVAIVIWLVLDKQLLDKSRSPLLLAVWCVGGFLFLCCEAASIIGLAGALICLHRDSLEMQGMPYVGRPREWHGGLMVTRLRALLRAIRDLSGRRGKLDLRAGELVEICSREEILATLDCRGELESLPFMPEMESWCGRRARVFRRVDKIFDWIHLSGMKRMRDTVILESLRCDGSQHGGCQADCPLLWKEAWLRRATAKQNLRSTQVHPSPVSLDLCQFTRGIDVETSEPRYVCQLTRLPDATTPTPWNHPGNLLRDLFNGNIRLGPFFTFLAIHSFNSIQRRRGGMRFPFVVPSQLQVTPHEVLNVQPGELVRIKSKREIERTLNAQLKTRGLSFDREMTRFCGGTYRVLERVTQQIDEKSGKMIHFTNPCIALEGVTATAEYHEFAPLDERIYWREIWLTRIEDKDKEGCSFDKSKQLDQASERASG